MGKLSIDFYIKSLSDVLIQIQWIIFDSVDFLLEENLGGKSNLNL